MNKKITLLLNEAVIEKAKIYAANTGNSLSGLVEDYFEKLVNPSPQLEISESLQALAGKIKLPADFDDDLARRKAVEEKHLR